MLQRRAINMLDCQDSDKEGDNCTHCHTASGDNRLYWGIQLDQDLLDTIVGIYPEWFKDCNMNLAASGDATDPEHPKPTIIPLTPDTTKTDGEDQQQDRPADRSKESLRSPPAFHEQRQKLERSKMGDLLKSKIQKRPDRQALIQQHTLEDVSADLSLQEKQRQLKKARIADVLSSQMSHQPGSLDIVKGALLQADEFIAQAMKEGSIPFRNSYDVSSPATRITPEDDSCSEGASPSPSFNFSEHSQGSVPSLEASEPSPITNNNHGSPSSARTSFSMSPPSSVSSPLSVIPSVVSPQTQSDQVPDLVLNGLILHSKETPTKNRKKTKPKTQPKARTIKFHEYKGPPNAQKNTQSSSSTAPTETSYDLLLQQQQLFLQWQLEWQQKYPQSVLPTNTQQMPTGDQSTHTNPVINTPSQTTNFESPPSPQKVITKLEDLKVSDLKAELKKRNLPVSGPKPVLIERLKSYAESSQNKPTTTSTVTLTLPNKATSVTTNNMLPANLGDTLLDSLPTIPVQNNIEVPSLDLNDVSDADISSDGVMGLLSDLENGNQQTSSLIQQIQPTPATTVPMDVDSVNIGVCTDVSESSAAVFSNEEIVQLQQRCIEKLQMELQKSQLQLQQTYIGQPTPSETAPMDAELTIPVACQPMTTTNSPPSPVPPETSCVTSEAVIAAAPLPQPPSEILHTRTSSSSSSQIASEEKNNQRQLIYQQLHKKIHQQSQQAQQQKLKKLQQQSQSNENTASLSAAISNATLTALLESQPVRPPVEINLGIASKSISKSSPTAVSTSTMYHSIVLPEAAEKKCNSVSKTCASADFMKTYPAVVTSGEEKFPGVEPLLMDAVTATPVPSENRNKSSKNLASTRIAANRTSSLPSFSALVNNNNNKLLNVRSNTDPQFIVARPPPNYNEATRQMSKIKQQFLQAHDFNGSGSNTHQVKKRKSSVKCQDVDDVLEILIKNGELPPSAAQEPQTPVTPKTELTSLPPYQNSLASSPPAAVTMMTNITSPVFSTITPVSSSCESDQQDSLNAHMSSLQSVLDMTPPSSAGFGEPNKTSSSTPPSLDFDFHLDMEDIDVMDFGGITNNEQNNISSPIEPVSKQTMKHTNSLESSNMASVNTNHLLSSGSIDYGTRGVDTDILEWLELLGENNGNEVNSCATSHSSYHNPSYSISNDNDPMFSNMANTHDSLDLFSVEDMDFKPSDSSVLSWEKVDFAT